MIYTITKYLLYPVIIGIVSTAMYVLIFDMLFSKIILPGYFSRKYKSTRIDGKWSGGNTVFKFEMIIKQIGDKVEGEIIAYNIRKIKNKEGGSEKEETKFEDANTYVFNGEIKDGFVRIVHKEKDRNSFGFGSFLFQIAGGGKVLNGSVLFVNESEDGYSVETSNLIKLERL